MGLDPVLNKIKQVKPETCGHDCAEASLSAPIKSEKHLEELLPVN